MNISYWGAIQLSRPLTEVELCEIIAAADFAGFFGYEIKNQELVIDTEDELRMKGFFIYFSFIANHYGVTGNGAIMSAAAGTPYQQYYYVYKHDHLAVVLDDPDHINLYEAINRSSGFALLAAEVSAFNAVPLSELDTIGM